MVERRTVQKPLVLSGIGLHSGKPVSLTLKPSSSGRIVFRRLDCGSKEIEVDPWKVEANNCSSLVSESCAVQTVEHLLAVLFIFGIDSLEADLDGPEIPVTDGSARPLAQAIIDSGIKSLREKKKVIKIVKSHTLAEAEASVSFSPDPDFRVTYSIDFPHPLIQRQELSLALTRELFLSEIAPARTFGFLKDVPSLWRKGLAQGGSLENAVVLDEERVISGSLRYPDEFVRHKILDLIGDLALCGSPILGHFQAHRAGHGLHLKAVQFLLQNPEFWAFEEAAAPRFLQG